MDLTLNNDHLQSRNEYSHEEAPYDHLYVPEPKGVHSFSRKQNQFYKEYRHTCHSNTNQVRVQVVLNMVCDN